MWSHKDWKEPWKQEGWGTWMSEEMGPHVKAIWQSLYENKQTKSLGS